MFPFFGGGGKRNPTESDESETPKPSSASKRSTSKQRMTNTQTDDTSSSSSSASSSSRSRSTNRNPSSSSSSTPASSVDTLRKGLADPSSSPFKPRPTSYTPTPITAVPSSSFVPADESPIPTISSSSTRTKNTKSTTPHSTIFASSSSPQPASIDVSPRSSAKSKRTKSSSRFVTNDDTTNTTTRTTTKTVPTVSSSPPPTGNQANDNGAHSPSAVSLRIRRTSSTSTDRNEKPSSASPDHPPLVSSPTEVSFVPSRSHHPIVGLHDHTVPEHLRDHITTGMDDDELHSSIHDYTQKYTKTTKPSSKPSCTDVYREPGIDSEEEEEQNSKGNRSSSRNPSTSQRTHSSFLRFLNRNQTTTSSSSPPDDDDPQPPSSQNPSNTDTSGPRFTNRSRLPLAVIVKREQDKMEPVFELVPPSKSVPKRGPTKSYPPPDTALSINHRSSDQSVRSPTHPDQPDSASPDGANPPEGPVILYGPDGQPLPPHQQPSNRPPATCPCFSCLMFLGCIIGFALTLWKTGGFAPLKENPTLGPSSEALIWGGAKVTSLIVNEREWWRIISPLFLHAGVIHLFSNMSLLYRYGFQLESTAGTLKFATLYIFSGIFSIIVSSVFTPTSVTVGASGALFGVFGAFLAELIQNFHMVPTMRERLCSLFSLTFSISLNLAIGILPFVDNFAHIGGLIGGMLLGFPLLIYLWGGQTLKRRQFVTGAVSTVLFVILFTITVILLYLGVNGNSFCSWCHFISCVPSPYWTCPSS